MRTPENGMHYLTGFAIGATIGAVVALLLAPRPGRETREMLGDKAHELKDKTVSAFRKGAQSVEEKVA